MATLLSNLFSFILPSNPPPKASPPPPPTNQISQQKPKNVLVSKMAPHQETYNSFSSSSSTELASAICPSLAYANTLFFKSSYNVQVLVDDNEPEERLLNRFRREVMRAGIIQESKRRRFFENKQDEKKRRTREAAKRNRRRRTQFRGPTQNKQEDTPTKKDDGDEDNWEMPEGDIPY